MSAAGPNVPGHGPYVYSPVEVEDGLNNIEGPGAGLPGSESVYEGSADPQYANGKVTEAVEGRTVCVKATEANSNSMSV